MPHDVATRWNSTYDMLLFAVEYQVPLKLITSDIDFTLRAHQLTKEEWTYAEQLADALKVSFSILELHNHLTI